MKETELFKTKTGVDDVVEMLVTMDKESRTKLLDNLRKKDPELVRKIEQKLFSFNN